MSRAPLPDEIAEYLRLVRRRPRPRRRGTDVVIARRRDEARRRAVEATDPLRRVQHIQERLDLERELAVRAEVRRLAELEAVFIATVAADGPPGGLDRRSLRRQGVPAQVLRRAGL